MVKRFDTGSLARPERLPNGWLRVDGYITRTGIFAYRNPDGSVRRELRLPDEVFRADSLASFSSVPVTDGHPEDMLTAENARDHLRGFVCEVPRRDGDRVRTSMLVMDAELIEKMEAGTVQTSCGYECDLDETPGEHNGERYDAIQRNIRANHVAILRAGRAGPDVKIRMDAACMVAPTESQEHSMKITINGVEHEVSEQVGQAITAERADAAAQVAAATKRADAAEGAVEAARAELQTARADAAARTDAAPVDVDALVAARLDLIASAGPMLGDGYDFKGKSAREIKVAVLTARGGKFDGASDERVDGAFDFVLASAPSAVDAARAATVSGDKGAAKAQERADVADADTARAAMLERNRKAAGRADSATESADESDE